MSDVLRIGVDWPCVRESTRSENLCSSGVQIIQEPNIFFVSNVKQVI